MGRARCVVLIDLANISSAFDSLKRTFNLPYESKLDYVKLVDALTLGTTVVEKSIYTEKRPEADNWKKFQTALEFNGFRVVSKELKEIRTANGTRNKANFDVEIATDVCRYVWRRDCNEVILASGDSDFSYLVDSLKELDIKVTIVSSRGTLSRELKERSDRLILLDELQLKSVVYNPQATAS